MSIINLTPFVREYIVPSGDAWVFRIKMHQMVAGDPQALDITGFSFKGTLLQKIDNSWHRYTEFSITNEQISAQNPGNGIYMDLTDLSKSTIIFAFDWLTVQPEQSTLVQEGEYQLIFSYTSPIGFRKTFLKYKVTVTEDIRDGDFPSKNNIEYCLTEIPADIAVYVYNTAINQINS